MTDVLSPPPAPPEALELPAESLWRVRLRLAWETLQKNWALFRSNAIGLIGFGIILMFGLMAVMHPILLDGFESDQCRRAVSAFMGRGRAHHPRRPTHAVLGGAPFRIHRQGSADGSVVGVCDLCGSDRDPRGISHWPTCGIPRRMTPR